MQEPSFIEIRVKSLVDAFFANRITPAEFKRELAIEKVRLIRRRHRKSGRKKHPRGI